MLALPGRPLLFWSCGLDLTVWPASSNNQGPWNLSLCKMYTVALPSLRMGWCLLAAISRLARILGGYLPPMCGTYLSLNETMSQAVLSARCFTTQYRPQRIPRIGHPMSQWAKGCLRFYDCVCCVKMHCLDSPLVVETLLLVYPVACCLVFGQTSTTSPAPLVDPPAFQCLNLLHFAVCSFVYTVCIIILVHVVPAVLLDFPLASLISNSCYYLFIL